MSPEPIGRSVEFAVVGGGLAGSTLATLLAQSGREVLLIEREDFPRDKLCGEFLSAESQAILRKLGVIDRVEAAQPPAIGRARFIGRSGRTVRVTLPAPALGISRRRLDADLFDAARSAGAQTWTKAEVMAMEPSGLGHRLEVRQDQRTLQVEAATVICAHGRRGRPDHAVGRSFLEHRHPFAGLKRHHRPTEDAAGRRLAESLVDHVEIYPFRGGYCGMSFIETGEVNVCMLVHQDVLRGAAGWEQVISILGTEHPGLAKRLHALTPTDPRPLAVGAVPFSPKSRYEGGVFFVGDAAGMIAPLVGDGQAMALESAGHLADILLNRGDQVSTDRVGGMWDRRWRRAYAMRMRLAKGLQGLMLQPATAEAALMVVGSIPGLPDLLGRMTRGKDG